jgi:hypothetical protein
MNAFLRFASPMIGLALVAATSPAQGITPGVMNTGLVAFPTVQKELKLDEEQVRLSIAFTKEHAKRLVEEAQKLGAGQGEDWQKKARLLDEARTSWGLKRLAEILRPEQFERYKQIELQARGAEAFADPEVARRLSLSAEQSARVATLIGESKVEISRIAKTSPGAGAVPKIMKVNEETTSKARAVLDGTQARLWSNLTGKPFTLFEVPR